MILWCGSSESRSDIFKGVFSLRIMPTQFLMILRCFFWTKSEYTAFLSFPYWFFFVYTQLCIIVKIFRQISLSFIVQKIFCRGLQLFRFKFLSSVNCPNLESNWLLIFCISFSCGFRRVSKQIPEMFFPLMKSFFLAGIFQFCSRDDFPSANFIYCLRDCLRFIEFLLLLFLSWTY